jgi:uncharacterized repeat protein (TIGR03803 family)
MSTSLRAARYRPVRVLTVTQFAAMLLLLAGSTAVPAQSQTFTVLHEFTGGPDGYQPQDGLTSDAQGNLYGTTEQGGIGYYAYGVGFKLSKVHSNWVVSTLAEFGHDEDGYYPYAGVTFGPDVAIYGTTGSGGVGCGENGCGTLFRLTPPTNVPRSIYNPYSRTVIYRFSGPDGQTPLGRLIFDRAGNMYGTTSNGGPRGAGTIFQLTRNGSQWTMTVLYGFGDGFDGGQPWGELVMDAAGNLYGTNAQGGGLCYCGVVFELSPSAGGWNYQVLHTFVPAFDGGWPRAGLTMDAAGSLYGTTSTYGPNGGGTVFELSPTSGGWNFNIIYALSGGSGDGPAGALLIDSAGNLYGTTQLNGAYNEGSVFKLTPQSGAWAYTALHDFDVGDGGSEPKGNLLMDSSGNLYGMTSYGGRHGGGTVWEITP